MDALSQTSHRGQISDSGRYARCIQTSKRVRWDVDKDVIRGRRCDAAHKFLPDGLSLADAFTTLSIARKLDFSYSGPQGAAMRQQIGST